jgi:hypothetical protein
VAFDARRLELTLADGGLRRCRCPGRFPVRQHVADQILDDAEPVHQFRREIPQRIIVFRAGRAYSETGGAG